MKHSACRYGLSVLLSLCCLGGNAVTPAPLQPSAAKAVSLKRAKPKGTLQTAMDAYLKDAREQKLNIQSVMVLQHGKVLYEKWLNGGEP